MGKEVISLAPAETEIFNHPDRPVRFVLEIFHFHGIMYSYGSPTYVKFKLLRALFRSYTLFN